MSEKIVFQDDRITITNRKITVDEDSYWLVEILAIEIKQLPNSSDLNKAMYRVVLWGIFSILLTYVLPTFLVFIMSAWFIWRFFNPESIFPYVVYAETRKGTQLILSTYGKKYVWNIAQTICDLAGCDLLTPKGIFDL